MNVELTYQLEVFDNFWDAAAHQKKHLTQFLDEGYVIRCAEIQSDVDFDTKETMWSSLVRAFPIDGGKGI